MNRLFSSVLALAFCFSLGAVANAKSMANAGAHKGAMMSATHGCKKGQTWVKPYKRGGKMVSGYCRNAK